MLYALWLSRRFRLFKFFEILFYHHPWFALVSLLGGGGAVGWIGGGADEESQVLMGNLHLRHLCDVTPFFTLEI